MGKYIDKSMSKGEKLVAMDVSDSLPSQKHSLGVLTGPKTLAVKKPKATVDPSSSSHLHLRSCARKQKMGSFGEEEGSLDTEINLGLVGEEGMSQENGKKKASFDDNDLEFEGQERTSKKTTPCSLNLDSPVKLLRSFEDNSKTNASIQKIIVTEHEIHEVFAPAEEQLLRRFIEKYNFDPVKEEPLPGHYEWVKMDQERVQDVHQNHLSF